MKSCSQPACEQVSDAQNRQEGDKSIRFEIPSIKNQDEGRRKKDKKQDRASCPTELKPRLCLPWILSEPPPHSFPPPRQPLPPLENWSLKKAPLPIFAQ